ncbi:MAG: reprolysin-like metallopeptidase, partial [Bacteroidota bacterium]
IRSYAGVGLDDPTASLRFDVTQFGFHAFVITGNGNSIFIDPYSKADTEHYMAYYKSDYQKIDNNFTCHFHNDINDDGIILDGPNVGPQGAGDCQLRTYRLALSCTGEYAQFHGGTKAAVMAAMNTTMTRVNGIFERDFNVNMVLVANNENLIYLNASTDPYDDSSTSQLINESQTQCDNIIGNGNYDIGHVFSTGGGGLAGLGVVCNDNNKGRGVTGTNNPVGDPFDVDYVAHELGHQFGANHTFNNSCGGNRSNTTAMEPGSGSTIMAYAGICAPNLQFNSDAYFHAVSIQEVSNYINNSTGNACAVLTNTGNNNPTVSGGMDYVLPIGTPFKLTADGSDADGDALTYCWEQMDNEITTMPPVANNTDGPTFRSYAPTGDAHRYFPKLSDVVNGVADQWEILPTTSREMNFRVTARDNHAGSGCTSEDDVTLTFSDGAGPFVVEVPNASMTWFAGSAETVTWDVAKTDQAPVNCAHVDIMISFDGGLTYPTTLASNVPNDGAHDVLVPDQASAACRVMVVCSDNIFYDISNNNFTIDNTSSPTFSMLATPDVQDVCGSIGMTGFELNLNAIAGFNESVTLTAQDVPDGATASFSQNNFIPTSTTILNVENLGNVPNGIYEIKVLATAPSITIEQMVTLVVNNTIPEVVTLNSPALGATEQNVEVVLDWENDPMATGYSVEIATSPIFGNTIVETTTVSNNTFTPQNLQPLTVYYWRVKAANNCGESDLPSWFSFQTKGEGCNTYSSIDIPVDISASGAPTINSTLQVNDQLPISAVKVSTNIAHSWIGDLKATLENPNGTSVTLLDRPGVPDSDYGCQEDNISVTFDDQAENNADDFENSCSAGVAYAIEGTFQPIDALSVFANGTSNGAWKLEVQDFENNDGGTINNWSLEICYSQTAGAAELSNNTFTISPMETKNISNDFLQASSNTNLSSELTFVVLSLPAHGSLTLSGNNVVIGTTFTQADIDNNSFTYAHNGNSTAADGFQFDVFSSDGAWIPNQTFNIMITSGQLTATAEIEQEVSCFGSGDGMIYANASGGTPPFSYSLNGGAFQDDPMFDELPAGTYSIVVKDANGTEVETNTVTLENPAELMMDVQVNGNTITITASGGTGILQYSLNSGVSQVSNIFENVAPGSYSVITSDENFCSIIQINIDIAAQPITVSAVVEKQISCHNETDGIIYAVGAGGYPPLTYSINGSAYQENPAFENLAAGTYAVSVKDDQGTIVIADEIKLENPALLSLDVTVVNNIITANVTGGTGSLTYVLNDSITQDSSAFTELPNGFYNITITDEKGCTISQNNIEVGYVPMSASAVVEQEMNCHDDQGGIIVVAASGGNSPLQYSLNGVDFQESSIFENLNGGIYSVTVMDAIGDMITTNQVEIINPEELLAFFSVVGNNVTINGSGGTGNLSYSINGGTFQNSNVFTGLINGTHFFTVMDENECTVEVQVTINVIQSATVQVTNPLCFGDENGSLKVAGVTGGQMPYLYSLDNINFSANNEFTLGAGTYAIFIMDATGAIFSAGNYTIANGPTISVTALADGNTITANGLGGTGTLMYSIDGVTFQESNIFEGLPNGTYSVTVMDENECSATSIALTINITSILDLNFDISFELYPNPNQGLFTIELNQPTEKILRLQIFDVAGRLIREMKLEKNQDYTKEVIDVTQIASGSYEILLTDGVLYGRKRFVRK